MNANDKQTFLGKKIWYGFAITLSVLVILVSIAAVAGTWILGSTMSTATMQLLLVVENSAGSLSSIVEGIDLKVVRLEETSFVIMDATEQLSQNVADKGLVLTLLPEEREQRLVTQAQDLQQNLNAVADTLRAGIALYQSIDSLPFISLPQPDQQSINNLQQDIAGIQESIQEVVLGIQRFRDGVSGEIDRATSLLDGIIANLTETRQTLTQLNDRLQALQDLVARMRSKVTLVFNSLSAIITLLLAWIIYTQVEIIRTYVQRWKNLENVSVIALPSEESTDSLDDQVETADVPNKPNQPD